MALDPEELKHRRQARKAQREKARRQLLLRLAIAGVVLAVCAVLITVMALRPQTQPENPPSLSDTTVPDSTEGTLPDTVPESQPEQTVVHFVAGGDLNVTEKTVAAGGEGQDYGKAFLDVGHILAHGDLTTLNFEGDLTGEPYGASASAPVSMVQALRRAGVDMLQIANSYAINGGISGLRTTIEGVRQAGMEPLGVYPDQAAYRQGQGYTVFQVEGVRVGVVAFTKGMDGTTLPAGYENCVNVLYSDYDSVYQKINRDKISQVMDSLNREKPDVIIALLHWGSEYNDTISESQNSIVSLLRDKGADAIIGTHSHYVQKIAFDPEKGFLTAYSLGDFFGDASRSGSQYSILLDVEITKNNKTGASSVTGYTYTPIYTVHQEGQPSRVVRLREAITAYENGYIEAVTQEMYEDMVYSLTRIEQRIQGE